MQLPLWTPESDWRPPDMGDLPSWEGAARVAVDCETRDPDLKSTGIGVRRGGYTVGYSFAIEDGPAHYLPIRHEGGDNLDEDQVHRYLRDQAAAFSGQLVGANLPYDLDYMEEEGIDFPGVELYRDVQVADPLIYELHQSYSLAAIAGRYGLGGKDEDLLRRAAESYGVDPKGGLWRLPARFVGAYAEEDARLPLQLIRRQERRVDELDLWDIYDLESRVLPLLVTMRRRGVRVDEDRLEQVEEWSVTEEHAALETLRRETGVRVRVGDVWKAEVLAPALDAAGIPYEQTSKGLPSIKAGELEHVDHAVARAIVRARKVNKLRTTFAASIKRYITRTTGEARVHCTFNQIARESEKGGQQGVRYGRLSATDPNMQQQPSRDEFAAMWKSIYLPEDGQLWASNDYSQQEPRWIAHFSALLDLDGAAETVQAYHDDPLIDNHKFMAELTGLKRERAKNIYLGIGYGEGGAKMCREIGIPTRWAMSRRDGGRRVVDYFESQDAAFAARRDLGTGFIWEAAGEEGQAMLDQFDERAPFIRQLSKAAGQRASARGFIVTGGGRRLHFPQKQDGSYDWTHKALNRLIQGTSADQMKRAMVEIDRAGHWLMLQVHDDAPCSVKNVEEARAIAKIMSEAMTAKVPFHVDTKIGPNWGETEKI